jgi:type I restriction enzyme S subunit
MSFDKLSCQKGNASSLPKGWEIKKLGEVCETGAGGTPLKTHKDYYEGGTIPWLLSGEVSQGEIFEAKNCITEKGLRNSSAKLFPPNTVLVAMYGATAGQVGILRFEACTNQAVCGILPNDKTLPEYLFYCFLSKKEELVAQAVGGAQPNISQIKIRNTRIPLPPLPEQQRIVFILDESFSAIERSRNNAEQNLKNAKELFESYLQGVFEKKGDGWEVKNLKELTTKIGSGATPLGGQESYKSEGISLVRSMNVHDWEFRDRNLAFIDEKQAKELDGVTLQEKDVLLNITGASVARCCVFPKEYLPARVNQHVSIIRPKKEILDARFLNLLLTSKPYKDQLLFTGEQGATRQAITKAQIETFKIAIPPLKDQQTIVRQLDALRAETQKLEAVYQKKIADLEELKKSILQKAFAGELKTEKELI